MPQSPRLTLPTAMVLLAVSRNYRYGFDISDVTGLPSGTVYPVLRRLEDAGLLRSRWEAAQTARAEQRPPRRYYTITASGAQSVRDAVDRYPTLQRAFDGPSTEPRPA
ncbi:MAG TPA: PadR family transcriptional regulator [Gemmatimonadaceae bacterium]|nr:PadR family transcriptional regulator [Gemmatimonadaceae bacterium]